MFSSEKIIFLKNRWKDKDVLIDEIINLIKCGNNSWISLIADMDFVDEVKNGRDLRGISLKNRDLKSFKFEKINMCYADFEGANLCGSDFSSTELLGANLEEIKVDIFTDWGPNFVEQKEKRKNELGKFSFFIKYEIIKYFGLKGGIYSEKLAKRKEDFGLVKKIYWYLRKAYSQIDSTVSQYFAYRELKYELKSQHNIFNPFALIGRIWLIISGGGSAPIRYIFFIFLFIIVCSCVYYAFPEGIVRNDNICIQSFGEALYFSVVTFSSLGYGDFHPCHENQEGKCLKYFCNFEALAGILALGLGVAIAFQQVTKK